MFINCLSDHCVCRWQ